MFFFLSQYSCCGLGLTGLGFLGQFHTFLGSASQIARLSQKNQSWQAQTPTKLETVPKNSKKPILQSLELLPCPRPPRDCFCFLFFLGQSRVFRIGFFGTVPHFFGVGLPNCETVPKKTNPGKPRPQQNSRLSQKNSKKTILQSLELLPGPRPPGIAFVVFFGTVSSFFGVWACQDWFFWDSLAFWEADPKVLF